MKNQMLELLEKMNIYYEERSSFDYNYIMIYKNKNPMIEICTTTNTVHVIENCIIPKELLNIVYNLANLKGGL